MYAKGVGKAPTTGPEEILRHPRINHADAPHHCQRYAEHNWLKTCDSVPKTRADAGRCALGLTSITIEAQEPPAENSSKVSVFEFPISFDFRFSNFGGSLALGAWMLELTFS